jgi:CheY-like chemotaxis protein
MTDAHTGKRVMVVEDEALVAMLTCDYLEDLGCIVVGPFASVKDALEGLDNSEIDCAILDVNLGGGENSFPIASALAEKHTPFVFATGYGAIGAKAEFASVTVLPKPFDEDQLAKALKTALGLK